MKVITFHTHQGGNVPAIAVKFGERTVVFAPETSETISENRNSIAKIV